MINIGSLCIVSADAERCASIRNAYENAGYIIHVFSNGEEALAAICHNQPDVALIGSNLDDISAFELVSRIRATDALARMPIAVDMAEHAHLDDWREGHDEYPEVNDILPHALDANAIVFRLQPLFRLSTMEAELVLRQANDQIVQRVSEQIDDASRCFYLSLNPAQNLPASFLSENTFWETATSISEAEAVVTGPGFFDVAVIDTNADNLDDVIQFCSDMRDNPRLFNLPFLIRAPGLSEEDARGLYRAGANRVLTAEDCDETLRFEAMSLIRLQISRNVVRDTLRRTLTEATGHPLESVYTEDFLRSYLAKRIDIAKNGRRALSVVHLHLPEAISLLEEAGEEACNALSAQLARWLSRLIRVEDLAARISSSDFVVILPDTQASEAQYVMNRIAGVLTSRILPCTMYSAL